MNFMCLVPPRGNLVCDLRECYTSYIILLINKYINKERCMRKVSVLTFLIFAFAFLFVATTNLWAQGYSGLNKEKERQYMTEINQMTQKIMEFESKVEELEHQKQVMENKFEQALHQRDQLYRINISRKLEAEIIKERLKYVSNAYEEIVRDKDNLIEDERQFVNAVKEDWLCQILEGADKKLKKKMLKSDKVKRLGRLKKSMDKLVDNSIQTEQYLTNLSYLYRNNEDKYLKRTSIDEDFIDSMEDNLSLKKKLINDLRDSVAMESF